MFAQRERASKLLGANSYELAEGARSPSVSV